MPLFPKMKKINYVFVKLGNIYPRNYSGVFPTRRQERPFLSALSSAARSTDTHV